MRLARDTYRIRFACPEIARRIVPGQFVMLRLADCNDPLLGRPLALYDVVPDAAGQAALPGHRLSGRGQDDPAAGRVPGRLAAGGLGAAGQRLSAHAHRAPGDGGRRDRANALSGPGPRVSRPARLRRSAAAGAPRPKSHALLRRPQPRVPGRRGRFSPPGRRRAAEHRRRLARASTGW